MSTPIPANLSNRWLILWDGECGFCRRSVEAVLHRDRRNLLCAIPYQDCQDWLPAEILHASPNQAHLRSPDGRYWGGGDAVVELVSLAGYPRVARVLRLWPMRWLVRLGYRAVARNRSLFSRWGRS